jgi:hypothetical protein
VNDDRHGDAPDQTTYVTWTHYDVSSCYCRNHALCECVCHSVRANENPGWPG